MALKLGSSTVGSLYLGSHKVSEAYLGSVKVYSSTPVDPYNPLGLPPFTLRVEFTGTDASYDPTQDAWIAGSWTAVGGSVWDWTYQNAVWHDTVRASSVLAYYKPATNQYIHLGQKHCNILGGNTTGVTDMANLFAGHRYLGSIALFDTSSVVDFSYFCLGHTQGGILTSIPLFNTSSAVTVESMFANSKKVQSGALALYTQMSTQATPPTTYYNCFYGCGIGTTSGAAELAQIPTSWGGTMA
jgi:hypothetical protein